MVYRQTAVSDYTVFGSLKSIYRGFEAECSSVAAQPVGFSSGLLAAKQRIAVIIL